MADPNEIVISATFVADELKRGITEAAEVWQAGFDKMGEAAKLAETVTADASTGLIRSFVQLDDSTKNLASTQKTAVNSAKDLAAAILSHKTANDALISSSRQVEQVQDSQNFSSQNLIAALKNEAIAKMQAGSATDALKVKTLQAAEAQALLRAEIAGTQRALTWAKTNEPASVNSAALIAQARAARGETRTPGIVAAPQTRRPDGTPITDPKIIADEQASQHNQAAMLLKFAGQQQATGSTSGRIQTISADNLVVTAFKPVRPANLGEGELESYKQFRQANLGPATAHFGGGREGMTGMNQAWQQVKAEGGTPGTAGNAAAAQAAQAAQLVAAAEEKVLNVKREASFAEARHKAAIEGTIAAKKAYVESCENTKNAAQAEMDANKNASLVDNQRNQITELHNNTLKQRELCLNDVKAAEEAEAAAAKESAAATAAVGTTQLQVEQETTARIQTNTAAITEKNAAQQQGADTTQRATALSGLMSDAEFREAQARRQGAAAATEQTAATTAETAATTDGTAATTANVAALSEAAEVATKAGISEEVLAAALANAANLAARSNEALRGLKITCADEVDQTNALRDAFANLNTCMVAGAGQVEFTKDSLVALEGVLKKNDLALIQTANGFKIVGVQAAEAAPKMTAFGNAENYAAFRGGAMLAGLNSMAFAFGMLGRALGPITGAMTMLFVPVMIGMVAESVEKMADSFKKVSDNIRKANVELDDLVETTTKHTTALALENLKLEDQLSKLTTGITHNAVAEALIEANMKAGELNRTLSDTLEKETELFEKQKIKFLSMDFIIHGQQPTTDELDKFREKSEPYRAAIAAKGRAQSEIDLAETKMTRSGIRDEETGKFKGPRPGMEAQYIADSAEREKGIQALAAAQTKVTATEKVLRDAFVKELEQVERDIKAKSLEYQKERTITTVTGATPVTNSIPAMSKEAADERANSEFAGRSSLANTVLSTLNQGDQQTLQTEDAAALQEKIAQAKPPEGNNIKPYMEELEKMRAAQGIHHQLSLQSEVDYWNGLIARSDAGLLKFKLTHDQMDEVLKQRDAVEKASGEQRRTLRDAEQRKTGAEHGGSGTASKIADLQADIALLEQDKTALLTEIAGHPARDVTLSSANSGTTLESTVSTRDQEDLLKKDTQIADKRKALNKVVADEVIREEEEQFNAAKKGSQQRIEIAAVEVAMLEQLHLKETDAYKTAQNKLTEAKRDAAHERASIAEEEARHVMSMAEIELKTRKDMYEAALPASQRFSRDKIAHDVEYENELHVIQQREIQDRIATLQILAASGIDVSRQLEKLQDEAAENDLKHAHEMLKIQQEVYAGRKRLEDEFSQTMERSEQAMLNSIFTGWKDFHKAVLGLEKGLLNDITGSVAHGIQSHVDNVMHPMLDKVLGVKSPDTKSVSQMEAKAVEKSHFTAATTQLNAANIQLQAAMKMDAVFARYGVGNPNVTPWTALNQPPQIVPPIDLTKQSIVNTGNTVQDKVLAEARNQGVNQSLAQAVAGAESGYNQGANSKAGAHGVMQLMPNTAKTLGVDINNEDANIKGGVQYLKEQLQATSGDTDAALARYNMGPEKYARFQASGKPLPKETQDYIADVHRRMDKFNTEHPTAATSGMVSSPEAGPYTAANAPSPFAPKNLGTAMGTGENLGIPADDKAAHQSVLGLTQFKIQQNQLQLTNAKKLSNEQLNLDKHMYTSKLELAKHANATEMAADHIRATQKLVATRTAAATEITSAQITTSAKMALGTEETVAHVGQQTVQAGATVASNAVQSASDAAKAAMDKALVADSAMAHAKAGAIKAFDWASGWGGPIAGAIAAAAAFAGEMAYYSFETGGVMPSTGMAMVHQGEGVLTAPTTKMLQHVNNNISTLSKNEDTMQGGHTFNFAIHGATDPKAVADHVMTKIQRYVKTSGVMRS